MSKQTLYFHINGMTCSQCEKSLERMIAPIVGVKAVCANHGWSLLTVEAEGTPEELLRLEALIIQRANVVYEAKRSENPFTTPPSDKDTPNYFRYTIINIVVGILWSMFKTQIPGPLAPGGLSLGLFTHAFMFSVMIYTGLPFLKDAFAHLKVKETNMNTLVSLSILTAFVFSLTSIFVPTYFTGSYALMPVFMILGIVNFGKSLVERAKREITQLNRNFDSLFTKYMPATCQRIKSSGELETVASIEVKISDLIQIKTYDRMPVDGVLVSDMVFVDQKLLTGESVAVLKKRGDSVYAGSLCLGQANMQATHRAQDSALMRLLWRVRQGTAQKSPNNWVDRLSQRFVPIVIVIAVLAGLGWGVGLGLPLMAWKSVTSVLLCACPCALGLAAPLSNTLAMYKLLNKGILVKDPDVLKTLADVETIVFDKTGTLTQPEVKDSFFLKEFKDGKGLQWVASLEKTFISKHPIAEALCQAYQGTPVLVSEPKLDPSRQGVSGVIEGKHVLIGNLALMQKANCVISKELENYAHNRQLIGQTPLFFSVDGHGLGALGVSHILKPNVVETLSALMAKGHKLVLMTGDNGAATQKITNQLPFDEVYTDCTSEQKRDLVLELKPQGILLYMGDGANDIEAAQKSDVAVAIQAWTQLAANADISLKGDISDLPKAIEYAKLLQYNIKQNVMWTFFYNTISLIAASGLLYYWLGATNPVVFAASMALSSLGVVGNALRLPGQMDRVSNPIHRPLPKNDAEFSQTRADHLQYKSLVRVLSHRSPQPDQAERSEAAFEQRVIKF